MVVVVVVVGKKWNFKYGSVGVVQTTLRMLQWVLHKVQFLLLLITPFPVFVFIWGVIQEITNPDLKNLPAKEYAIAGVVLIALLTSDYFFIKNRFKRQK